MNRLIIIGNGFDLAHKLSTKYSDFLLHYWNNVGVSYEDDLITYFSPFTPKVYNSLFEIQTEIQRINENIYSNLKIRFEIKNNFFQLLNEKCNSNNWVDIEMFYYDKLKLHLNSSSSSLKVKKLNDEFNSVKKAFENYITNVINEPEILKSRYSIKIGKIFEPMKFSGNSAHDFIQSLPYNLKRKIQSTRVSSDPYDLDNLHILNFNYTNTVDIYDNHIKKNRVHSINHIHGEASNDKNKIVFGFGDEKDKLFPEIEDKNENEYLRFMKSAAYLQTKNYSELLNFIESGNFMLDILGHSCGLSDRTLLKTIFEHKYCQFIRIHYHEYEPTNENINQPDNYTELIHNISRHFVDKTVLREKVANKEISTALPQFRPKE